MSFHDAHAFAFSLATTLMAVIVIFRAGAIGPCAGSHAREERKSEHRKREEEPAEEADGGDAEENADEDHGGVFRQMSDGRASTTTTAHMRD